MENLSLEEIKEMAAKDDQTLLAFHWEGDSSEASCWTAERIIEELEEAALASDTKPSTIEEAFDTAYVCTWEDYEEEQAFLKEEQ